jgi:hypothetical protein
MVGGVVGFGAVDNVVCEAAAGQGHAAGAPRYVCCFEAVAGVLHCATAPVVRKRAGRTREAWHGSWAGVWDRPERGFKPEVPFIPGIRAPGVVGSFQEFSARLKCRLSTDRVADGEAGGKGKVSRVNGWDS